VGWTNEDWGSFPGRKKKFAFLHTFIVTGAQTPLYPVATRSYLLEL